MSEEIEVMRLKLIMTEVEDIEPAIGDAARTSVEHCIITFCKGPSRIRTAGRSVLYLIRGMSRKGRVVT